MWHRRTISEMADALMHQRISAVELTQHFLDRIELLNLSGPKLNAVREINPAALSTAEALDREREAGRQRGPLHGVPVLLKDNIATGDGMACTAGSLALSELRPIADAGLVRRLRSAGAVILGKTNLTEFADYLSGTMPAEFSSAGKVVRHPYGQRYGRGCGSSVGSACAVAAGLTPLAIGSETQNSIQTPASLSSVVGLKPTVGLISRSGIVPLAISQDSPGPLAGCVADVAIALSVLAGADLADSLTLAAAPYRAADYGRWLAVDALEGASIGVPRRVYSEGMDDAASAVYEQAIAMLRNAGAVIIDPADVPTATEIFGLRSTVFATEFKVGLNSFLASQGEAAPRHSLTEILEFNAAHSKQCLAYGQNLAEMADRSGGIDDRAYRTDRLRDIVLSREMGIDAICGEHRLDALVTLGGAAAKLTGKAGYPVLTVPAGFTADGQPIGISFLGPAFSEPRLIALGYAFEQHAGVQRPSVRF